MKFSLLSLSVAIASILVLIFKYTLHGKLGIALALPHVAVFCVAYSLYRRNRRYFALLSIAAYASCWIATHAFGNAAATINAKSIFARGEASVLLAYDPIREDRRTDDTPRAWHYFDTPSTPCPFVVRHYISGAVDRMGCSETAYYIWVPGYLHLWRTEPGWTMCSTTFARPKRPGNTTLQMPLTLRDGLGRVL